jgi:Rrf2 family protein
MKLSKRSTYGLRALIDLAINGDSRPVRLRELAHSNNIPIKFLEQIFLTLRHAGIVHSHLGANGGYSLGRPATDISIGEIIRALDGTIAPVSCVSQISYDPCNCPDEKTCRLRPFMGKVRDAIVEIVDTSSLADVAFSEPEFPSLFN